jgi:RNA polymerase sigma factor (sigma-70 family)
MSTACDYLAAMPGRAEFEAKRAENRRQLAEEPEAFVPRTDVPRLNHAQEQFLFGMLADLRGRIVALDDDDPERAVFQERFAEVESLLIQANLALVYKIANQIGQKFNRPPSETEELVSDGICGLLRAVDGFDLSRGCQFATFAWPCSSRAILRPLKKASRRPKLLQEPDDGSLELLVSDPHDDLAEVDAADLFEHAKANMTARQRLVVEQLVEGQTLTQIADNLGVTRQAVHQSARQAAQKFKAATSE